MKNKSLILWLIMLSFVLNTRTEMKMLDLSTEEVHLPQEIKASPSSAKKIKFGTVEEGRKIVERELPSAEKVTLNKVKAEPVAKEVPKTVTEPAEAKSLLISEESHIPVSIEQTIAQEVPESIPVEEEVLPKSELVTQDMVPEPISVPEGNFFDDIGA